MFEIRIEAPGDPNADVFGEPELSDLEWSKNSAYLAMGVSTLGLIVVDVKNQKVHGIVA